MSTTATATTPARARTYGNWRKPASAGLLGLGTLGTLILIGGLVFVILVLLVAGVAKALIAFAVVAALLMAVLSKDRHDRSLLTRARTKITWWQARKRGLHLYRSGPLGRTPWGTHQLPGIAASLRLSEHRDSYNRAFALLFCPTTNSYTTVISTEPDGASLVDDDQLEMWVADWGHWLANLSDEPNVLAASVTIESAPDTGSRLQREVATHLDPNAPAFAQAMLKEVVQHYPAGSSMIRAYVSITFGAEGIEKKKREADEVANDLAARLPGIVQNLQSTGAGAGHLMSAGEVCEMVRVAYDPSSAVVVDQAHSSGEELDFSWNDVGPTAAEAGWDFYRHEDAVSVTWAMSGAPRGNVQSAILHRFLAPHPEIARKRVSLLYRPIDAARAAALVESDLNAAEFRETANRKAKARDTYARRSAQATADEEAAGAGLVNFGMLVTATVTDPSRLAVAKAAVHNLAATARLRLRVVHGGQDSAFAACLPLGLVLQGHLKLPEEIREKL